MNTSPRAVRVAAVALAAAAVAGCAAPEVRWQTVTMRVPVPVPCVVTLPKEPDWRVPKLAADANVFVRAQAALADLVDSKQYERELVAAMAGCQKQTNGGTP